MQESLWKCILSFSQTSTKVYQFNLYDFQNVNCSEIWSSFNFSVFQTLLYGADLWRFWTFLTEFIFCFGNLFSSAFPSLVLHSFFSNSYFNLNCIRKTRVPAPTLLATTFENWIKIVSLQITTPYNSCL